MLLTAAGSIVHSVGRVVTDRHRGKDVNMRRLGVAYGLLASITGRTDPHRGDGDNGDFTNPHRLVRRRH